MPLVPNGLGKGLIDRIKDRVRTTLTPNAPKAPGVGLPPPPGAATGAPGATAVGTPPAPVAAIPAPPDASNVGAQGGEGLTSGFWDRIKQRVQDMFGGSGGTPKPPKPATSFTGSEVQARFQEAGRKRVLILMLYNNMWRHVEPYSFRNKGKGPGGILMFGWCRLHNEIHSFRPDRVQGMVLTDERFSPRWTVEF